MQLHLYSLLKDAAAARVGFLHIPQAQEFSADGAMLLDQLTRGVRAAAAAFAQALRCGALYWREPDELGSSQNLRG